MYNFNEWKLELNESLYSYIFYKLKIQFTVSFSGTVHSILDINSEGGWFESASNYWILSLIFFTILYTFGLNPLIKAN